MNQSHKWDRDKEKHIAATEFPDGNARTFRFCGTCGLAKITVHGSDGKSFWREWVTKDGGMWHGETTPPCLVGKPVELREAS